MEPVLFYRAEQGCAFGNIVALEWLCQPYRLSRLDEAARPAPALLAGRRTIRNCRAILRHLGARRGHLLGYRAGTPERARLDEMMHFLNTEMLAEQPRMEAACARLDALLHGREWLDGNKRTVADANFVALGRWAERYAGLDTRRYPHLRRHLRELCGDPAVYFADAIEQQRPAVSSGRFLGHVSLAELEPRLAA
ncbi:glutathione binding-like protein [Massilia sp. MB5]|uniref:glutathione S-transferase family protein n=1 Tax=Massilia sp. MB5 TaxID=2919578 RepID=UPI001F0F8B77|nr:glutathione binding-like protein [Massilia sp. MB5]UMR32950.1 glutathione binding-like protein [Massilia sp. MB5]